VVQYSIQAQGSGADPNSDSQPAGDRSHKPGNSMLLISPKPVVSLTTAGHHCFFSLVSYYTAWWQKRMDVIVIMQPCPDQKLNY